MAMKSITNPKDLKQFPNMYYNLDGTLIKETNPYNPDGTLKEKMKKKIIDLLCSIGDKKRKIKYVIEGEDGEMIEITIPKTITQDNSI